MGVGYLNEAFKKWIDDAASSSLWPPPPAKGFPRSQEPHAKTPPTTRSDEQGHTGA